MNKMILVRYLIVPCCALALCAGSAFAQDAAPASAEELQKKLDEAKAQRDADLQAAAEEKDPEKLEAKKREVFAKYAAVAAAMRDAYAKKQAEGGADEEEAAEPSKPQRKAKARPADDEAAQSKEDNSGKINTLKQKVAQADQKLQAEIARHESKVKNLEQKVQEAESSTKENKEKQVEKAKKNLEKENSTHAAKKAALESQKAQIQRDLDALESK